MKDLRLFMAIISSIGFIAGITFRLLHWPGADIILLTSEIAMVLFALLMIPLALKQGAFRDRFRYFSGIAGLTLAAVGFAFKMLHYPTANIQFLLGTLILCVLFLPAFFVNLRRKGVM